MSSQVPLLKLAMKISPRSCGYSLLVPITVYSEKLLDVKYHTDA